MDVRAERSEAIEMVRRALPGLNEAQVLDTLAYALHCRTHEGMYGKSDGTCLRHAENLLFAVMDTLPVEAVANTALLALSHFRRN